jgi:hypothetical protein
MAYTITKTGSREVTIVASDTNNLIVTVLKALDNYSTEVFIASTAVEVPNSLVVTYDTDGIYVFEIEEENGEEPGVSAYYSYVDLCVVDLYDHIAEDATAILNNQVDTCDYSGRRYDFIALILLGLHYFGNTTYALLPMFITNSTLPLELQLIQDAIARSQTYTTLNSHTTQSTN